MWEFAYDADGQRTTTWTNTDSTESFWEGKIVTSYDLAGRISAIEAHNQETPSNVVSNVLSASLSETQHLGPGFPAQHLWGSGLPSGYGR